MMAMKRPVLLLGFLCFLLAGGTAGGETLPRQTYQMTFRGFSEDTIRGIEEYIVEFPGYAGHLLVRQDLEGNEYRYESAGNSEGIAANLRRMFTYLDVEGRMDIDGLRITLTYPGYIPPRVPEKEVPQIVLPPPPVPAPKPKPLVLRLSTARGDMPAFAIGETFDLTVELSQDAWLYCLYRQVDGKVVKFFPNPHHKDAWLKGGPVHRIPGTIYPDTLAFSEPPGNELLTCFAADRDIRADLPAALRAPDLTALPPDVYSRLHELIDGIANVTIAWARLPIAVTR